MFVFRGSCTAHSRPSSQIRRRSPSSFAATAAAAAFVRITDDTKHACDGARHDAVRRTLTLRSHYDGALNDLSFSSR